MGSRKISPKQCVSCSPPARSYLTGASTQRTTRRSTPRAIPARTWGSAESPVALIARKHSSFRGAALSSNPCTRGGARLTDSSGCALWTGMARPRARRAPAASATRVMEASRLRLSPPRLGRRRWQILMRTAKSPPATTNGRCAVSRSRISSTSAALA